MAMYLRGIRLEYIASSGMQFGGALACRMRKSQ